MTKGLDMPRSRVEITVGVSDILNSEDDAVYSIGSQTAHLTPGRTLFLRLQWNF